MFCSFNIDLGVASWPPAGSCVTLVRRYLSVLSYGQVLGTPATSGWFLLLWALLSNYYCCEHVTVTPPLPLAVIPARHSEGPP